MLVPSQKMGGFILETREAPSPVLRVASISSLMVKGLIWSCPSVVAGVTTWLVVSSDVGPTVFGVSPGADSSSDMLLLVGVSSVGDWLALRARDRVSI